MTRPIPGAIRQHRILRALVEHGAMTLTEIRHRIGKPTHADMKTLCEQGYAVEAAKVPPKGPCTIKEVPVYKVTRKGISYAAVDLDKPVKKEKPKRVELILNKSKMSTKLAKLEDVEITYTEHTKYTVYQPQFTVRPYVPPKQFMECIR